MATEPLSQAEALFKVQASKLGHCPSHTQFTKLSYQAQRRASSFKETWDLEPQLSGEHSGFCVATW